MNDNDIKDLFSSVPSYEDAPAFQMRVMRKLRINLWLRQGFVVLAGFIGGLYALAQFVRLPNWTIGDRAVAGAHMARVETDQTLRAGVEFLDVLRLRAMNLFDSSAHTLNLMQTPFFFWVSFSLCLVCLALYYAYSQEEAI
ncbi:hypothetical protein [Asticcacaulis sp. 201]|uniref:hypothetical protein n=1 Tax=Asticcacaulis sp. 201 TaxID=3028787 RepID=UPI0029163A54|nr:hypothetical protein [Asticcacaulis sp. 201]MDV6329523.1 hypothetical protein [Asticcacaulis sp. 201]